MRITIKRIGILIIFCLFTIALFDCKKAKDEEKVPTGSKQVEKTIIAGTGGTLVTSDSVKLVIPPGALPSDGIVFVGITGSEPSTVPNKNLEIVGNPITLRFTSKSILKSIQLSFPRPTDPIDTTMCQIVMFNGNSYFPVEFSLTNLKVNVTIDKINWESNTSKGVKLIGDIIILIARNKQIPSATEMGLNKVSVNDAGNLSFNLPTANSTSKVLLLVHGWTGNANTWKTFIPKIIKETNPKYSEVWTFVYNSSLGIEDNAKILSSKLSTYSKGAQIDVVAHSMGGLVTRSMIEQNNGAQYINKLITLGSPHKGSPLALLRYFLGGIVFLDNPLNYLSYNYNTQGFRDLNINSKFITELNKLTTPPIKYYVIASTNDPSAIPRDGLEKIYNTANLAELLPTPNDGIVSVLSAKGVPSAICPNSDFNIPVILAHLEMPNDGPIYNQVLTFLRLGKPSVLTNEVTNKTQTSATVGGNVTSDGGATVTERGAYWGTSQNPETTGAKLQIGNGTGVFTSNLSELTPNTPYYVKAYAINGQGTAYGIQVSFTTSVAVNNPPTVPSNPNPTNGAIGVSTSSPILTWVTSDPESDPVTFDVYFGTTSNPTTLVGPNLTTMSYSPSLLNSGVTYYWKVVAKDNHSNTSPGPVWSFTTQNIGGSGIIFNPNLTYGTVSDNDGNSYKTIQLGTQTWMAENLKTTKYNDNTNIPNYWLFNNSNALKIDYGVLYDWNTVNTGILCPTGWHVPTDPEWSTLIKYIDPLANPASTLESANAGGKLKEINLTHWLTPNTGATNETGFTALPGGYRSSSGVFNDIGNNGIWWSSTEFSSLNGLSRDLDWNNATVHRRNDSKSTGFSVRCIKTEITGGTVPTNGLIAYYPFNGNANDESGNGNNGTIIGATLSNNRFGEANKAFHFDGGNQYITIPNSTSLNTPLNEISIIAWVKAESGGTNSPRIFRKGNTGYDFCLTTTAGLRKISFFPNSGFNYNNQQPVSSSSFSEGVWHQVVVTQIGTTVSFYIDGVSAGTVTSSQLILGQSSSIVTIGRKEDGHDQLKGSLDDIIIYNRALTAAEIQILYHIGGW